MTMQEVSKYMTDYNIDIAEVHKKAKEINKRMGARPVAYTTIANALKGRTKKTRANNKRLIILAVKEIAKQLKLPK